LARITTVRGDQVVREPDFVPGADRPPPEGFQDVAQGLILKELRNVASQLFDTSRPVDEYQSFTAVPTGHLTVEVQPEYEVDELIETIIIVATPAATVAIQLGNRFWSIVIPATGVVTFENMKMRLGRSDRRLFTLGAAGALSVELMGHADTMG
jgi:hypothetical protein